MTKASHGSKLRLWRKEHGLTQKELAELIGIQQGSVAAYETDARRPRVDVAARIDKATKGAVSIFGWAA